MLSISSGLLRGLSLTSPPEKLAHEGVRPTGQKTRQAVFNVLRHFQFCGEPILAGAVVADLFAGAGTLGLEAVSNGAKSCVFLEAHRAVLPVLQRNVAIVAEKMLKQGHEVQLSVLPGDALSNYSRLPSIRILFADAPYKAAVALQLLETEAKSSKIDQNGLLILEVSIAEKVPGQVGALVRFDEKIYGDTAVHFFVKKGFA
ncbi:MAG TPA: RsmD family RNA methyltransferase [Oligoflexia bacterium]|nr:RsmD family RNA methyltransferase [Oligoflexia bacterium]